MAKKILEVHQLTTKYITRQGEDVYSVDHVSLDIEEGKSLGIAGESGCGKSTLALSLMGYYFATPAARSSSTARISPAWTPIPCARPCWAARSPTFPRRP